MIGELRHCLQRWGAHVHACNEHVIVVAVVAVAVVVVLLFVVEEEEEEERRRRLLKWMDRRIVLFLVWAEAKDNMAGIVVSEDEDSVCKSVPCD